MSRTAPIVEGGDVVVVLCRQTTGPSVGHVDFGRRVKKAATLGVSYRIRVPDPRSGRLTGRLVHALKRHLLAREGSEVTQSEERDGENEAQGRGGGKFGGRVDGEDEGRMGRVGATVEALLDFRNPSAGQANSPNLMRYPCTGI